MHVGERTSTSPAETLYMQLAGARGIGNTIHTIAWYLWAGWFFGEIYIWTRSERAELAMVDPGGPYERPRLNENPIFLRCLFFVAGLLQAVRHLWNDSDLVSIPVANGEEVLEKNQLAALLGQPPSVMGRLPQSLRRVTERFGDIVKGAINTTIYVVFVTLFAYYFPVLGVRHAVWGWTYTIARIFFDQLSPDAAPSGISHFWRLFWQTLSAPMILMALWEISNSVFDSLAAQEPLRKGEPLTSEIKDGRGVVLHRSKDPNASLISGLKMKKEIPKSFAFWELFLICSRFESRRKSIYLEVNRNNGSTWSQILQQALREVELIQERIKVANEPLPSYIQQAQAQQQQQEPPPVGLKRIADKSVSSDANVFAQQKPDLVQTFGNMARSIGQSHDTHNPVSPRARKALQWSTSHLLSEQEQQRLSPKHLHHQASGLLTEALKSHLGAPFRQTFARRVRAVIFGTPHSNRVNIIHAIKALTRLCVYSLREDEYGQVQKDIGRIVRVLTASIKAVDSFVNSLQPHWTDVWFDERRDRNVPEIMELLDVLRVSLEEILLAFGEYVGALGLSKLEVREAREASAKSNGAKALPAVDERRPERIVDKEKRPEMVEAKSDRERQRRVYN